MRRSLQLGVTLEGVRAFAALHWDDALRDLPGSAEIGNKQETNTMAMINYQWSPVKAVTMGVEYSYFMVEEVDGDDGDASRLMFAAQYNF